ncbi:IclR family transcriptional regulator [Conexibacter arvalis]|uniref:DNA-binding IclR family transcriptional regulator n=1 Tax=Conexibacter arvalis TaxID=912552 RepID=A0A840ILI2_9ACTN|nr:IclR family transcriptional regulator [Conexibacter arvalis]MBB4664854.1 DNA-binding IclR family transcriptional regulator [Conexibacter arvalis]
MEQRATNYHARALSRGLEILRTLRGSDDGVTLAELHERTGHPKSTLVRLLGVLEEEGFVLRIDERPSWTLGFAVIDLASDRLEAVGVPALARPLLSALADETGATCNLGVLDGRQVLHVYVEEPDRPLRFRSSTGSRDDAYCTGLGKLLLAHCDEARLSDHLPAGEPYPRRTEHTRVTRARLVADLEETRERGYSFDDEEGAVGVRCLAVPLTSGGECVAALSTAGAASELAPSEHDRILAHLRATAARIEAHPALINALRITARSLAPTDSVPAA